MASSTPTPLCGITACLKAGQEARHHSVHDKYVDAVLVGTGALPVLVPAIGPRLDPGALLSRLDGLLVTGSPSNVHPSNYDGAPPRPGNEADPDRDATTLPLLRRAIADGVPVLAICRGIQELNVALGGTLHQHLQEQPGRLDHRSDKSKTYAQRYGIAHPITVTGKALRGMLGGSSRVEVNSLHGQGIDRLAPGLAVEAEADDGTIEAVSLPGAAGFVLGVQWHPEWQVEANPVSRRLFGAFAQAMAARAASRGGHARLSAVA